MSRILTYTKWLLYCIVLYHVVFVLVYKKLCSAGSSNAWMRDMLLAVYQIRWFSSHQHLQLDELFIMFRGHFQFQLLKSYSKHFEERLADSKVPITMLGCGGMTKKANMVLFILHICKSGKISPCGSGVCFVSQNRPTPFPGWMS